MSERVATVEDRDAAGLEQVERPQARFDPVERSHHVEPPERHIVNDLVTQSRTCAGANSTPKI